MKINNTINVLLMMLLLMSCQTDIAQEELSVSIEYIHSGGNVMTKGYDSSYIDKIHLFSGVEKVSIFKKNKDGISVAKQKENTWLITIIEKGKPFKITTSISTKEELRTVFDLYFLDFEEFCLKYQIK